MSWTQRAARGAAAGAAATTAMSAVMLGTERAGLARIMRPLHSQRPPAFASLVGTHLVYGAVLGRMGQ
jgi:hypothetical protein